jgi:outer membrane lipoprotein SlyB
MNAWLKRGLLALAGGAVGFAYYYFIGCTSGACPITSNPYISTAYGALIGGVIGMGAEKETNRITDRDK